MKYVKKFSFLSVPLVLQFVEVMVSPRHVYLYYFPHENYISFSHKEFYKYFPSFRRDFTDFVSRVFKITDYRHFL